MAKQEDTAPDPSTSRIKSLEKHILDQLYSTINRRRLARSEHSYTAKLFERGRPQITKKLGEEAVEVIVAALTEDRKAVITESGDLFYHLLVLWAETGVKPGEVWKELERRFGVSGINEKKLRQL